ncbi:MAG: hypothetical protein ACRDE7_01855, partial [Sphingobacterium sp.]
TIPLTIIRSLHSKNAVKNIKKGNVVKNVLTASKIKGKVISPFLLIKRQVKFHIISVSLSYRNFTSINKKRLTQFIDSKLS